MPAEISVFQGVVTAGEGTDRNHWRDRLGLEQFLIDQAFTQGHGELLGKVGLTRRPHSDAKQ